jgi:hypothetical protein
MLIGFYCLDLHLKTSFHEKYEAEIMVSNRGN